MGKVRSVSAILVLSFAVFGCKSNDQSVESEPQKPSCLPASIEVSDTAIGIHNQSSSQWTRIRVQVNDSDKAGGFRASVPVLYAGEVSWIQFPDLIRDDGLRFDLKTYAIDHVAFSSDQGSYNQIPCDREFTHRWIQKLSGSSK